MSFKSTGIQVILIAALVLISCSKEAPEPADLPENKMIALDFYPNNDKDKRDILYMFPSKDGSGYYIYYYYYDIYGVEGSYAKASKHEATISFHWENLDIYFKLNFKDKSYVRYGDLPENTGKFKIHYYKIKGYAN